MKPPPAKLPIGFIGDPHSSIREIQRYAYDAHGRRIHREQHPRGHILANGVRKVDEALGLVKLQRDHVKESCQYDGLSMHMLAEWHERKDRTTLIQNWKDEFQPSAEYLRAGDRLVVRTEIGLHQEHWGANRYRDTKRSFYSQDVLKISICSFRPQRSPGPPLPLRLLGSRDHLHKFDSLGYNGKRRDKMSGLLDYGFRDYSPTLQRWTRVDPIRDGVNWYAYVGNDPVNYVDPWGLSAEDEFKSWNSRDLSDKKYPTSGSMASTSTFASRMRDAVSWSS